MLTPRMSFRELRRTELQLERTWASDGLPELFLGVFTATCGALIFAASRGWWPAFVFVFLAPVGVRLLGRAMWSVKTRVTDPRLGYVRPRQMKLSKRKIVVILLLGAAINAMVRVVTGWAEPGVPFVDVWWPALATIPMVVTLFVMWWLLRLHRHFVVASAALVGAITGPLVGLPGAESLALSLVLIGLSMTAGGLWALRQFLRTIPRVEPG